MSTTSTTTLATSLVTPAPRLAPRDDDLLGYYVNGTTSINTCGGNNTLFTTSSGYAGCYQSPPPPVLYTSCTEIFSEPSTYYDNVATCVYGDFTCFTQTIYQTYPDIGPMTNFFCAENWYAYTLYRNIPSTTTMDSGTSQHYTTISTTVTATSTTTQSTVATVQQASSKAWIAGVAIGIAALIVLIGICIWFFRKRRNRKPQLPEGNDEDLNAWAKPELPDSSIPRAVLPDPSIAKTELQDTSVLKNELPNPEVIEFKEELPDYSITRAELPDSRPESGIFNKGSIAIS